MIRLVTWIRENGGGGRGVVRTRSQDSVTFWFTFYAQKLVQFSHSRLVEDVRRETGNTTHFSLPAKHLVNTPLNKQCFQICSSQFGISVPLYRGFDSFLAVRLEV